MPQFNPGVSYLFRTAVFTDEDRPHIAGFAELFIYEGVEYFAVPGSRCESIRELGYAISRTLDAELQKVRLVTFKKLSEEEAAKNLLGHEREDRVKCKTRWNGRDQERFLDDVFEILVPAVGDRVINVYQQHGSFLSASVDLEEFRLVIGATPPISVRTKDTHTAPKTMWGIRVPCTLFARHEWENGLPVITDEGDAVAGFNNNNLFIYHDAVHCGDDSEHTIFRRILSEAAKIIGDPVATAALGLAKERRAFSKICDSRARAEVRFSLQSIKRETEKHAEASQEIINASREIRLLRTRLVGIEEKLSENCAKFEKEFDILISMPHVMQLMTEPDVLIVWTDEIHCVDPRSGLVHIIGRFKIRINCSTGAVNYTNLTEVINYGNGSFHAPHVDKNGQPCLGSLAQALPELISNYEFVAAVSIAIQFLESVNIEDTWGMHIDEWPVLDQAVPDKGSDKKKNEDEDEYEDEDEDEASRNLNCIGNYELHEKCGECPDAEECYLRTCKKNDGEPHSCLGNYDKERNACVTECRFPNVCSAVKKGAEFGCFGKRDEEDSVECRSSCMLRFICETIRDYVPGDTSDGGPLTCFTTYAASNEDCLACLSCDDCQRARVVSDAVTI